MCSFVSILGYGCEALRHLQLASSSLNPCHSLSSVSLIRLFLLTNHLRGTQLVGDRFSQARLDKVEKELVKASSFLIINLCPEREYLSVFKD